MALLQTWQIEEIWKKETAHIDSTDIQSAYRMQVKSTRELALEWILSLSKNKREELLGVDSLNDAIITGRIEEIWRKENFDNDGNPQRGITITKPNQKQFNIAKQIVENSTYGADSKNHPINRKQFKEFNLELFKAYIEKFSDEDKLKALSAICESLAMFYPLNDIMPIVEKEFY